MPDRPKALITGAARRVGRHITLALADAGFDIAFTYHKSHDQAEKLAALLRAKGATVLAICADLTEAEKSADLIARSVFTQFNGLHVLVNNASIYQPDQPDADPTLPSRLWAIHFRAPWLLCRAFEKHLRQSRGHVVNMVDLLAEKPMPTYSAYCASKAALLNLTLSLAKELAPEVTVNAIAPGVVEWPENYSEADKAKYLSRVPLGRAGTPDDVARAVSFLATRADYITGQVLRLDGGRSLT